MNIMKRIVSLTLFILFFSLEIYAGGNCPAPFKEDDLFCIMRKYANMYEGSGRSDSSQSYVSGPNGVYQGPSVPNTSKGFTGFIQEGPNSVNSNRPCARLGEDEYQEDAEAFAQTERGREEWQRFRAYAGNQSGVVGEISDVASRENFTEAPGNSPSVTVELKDGDPETDGFYRYGPDWKKFGTEKTIWQLEEAGKKLAEVDMAMAVGNISRHGGGKLDPHQTHREGKNVDLRFMNSSGRGAACSYNDTNGDGEVTESEKNDGKLAPCYNREQTRIMLETVINVDPSNVKTVYVNDPALRSDMQRKFPGVYFAHCAGHDNHLHLTFKE